MAQYATRETQKGHVEEATDRFASLSRKDVLEELRGNAELQVKYIEQAEGDDSKPTVFGEGFSASENCERYNRLEADIQGLQARLNRLNKDDLAKERAQHAIDLADASEYGNIPKDTSEAQRLAQENGLLRVVRPDFTLAAKMDADIRNGYAPTADLPRAVSDKRMAAIGINELEGYGAAIWSGPQPVEMMAGGRQFGLAAQGFTDPLVADGGAEFFRPRDETRVVEKMVGQQFDRLLPLIPAEPFGRDAYKWMTEDTQDYAIATTAVEGRENKDGQTAQELTFHEDEKSVEMTEIRLSTRLTNNMIRFMPGFMTRAQARLVRYMMRRVEYQIINGDGANAGSNTVKIKGLLQDAGDTVTMDAAQLAQGLVRFGVDALTLTRAPILKAGGSLNTVVTNVDDFSDLLIERTNQQVPLVNPNQLPMGARWVVTEKLARGTALTGDTNQVVVPFSPNLTQDVTQDGRNMDRENGIWTIVLSGQWQLAIFREEAWQKVSSFASKVTGTKQ